MTAESDDFDTEACQKFWQKFLLETFMDAKSDNLDISIAALRWVESPIFDFVAGLAGLQIPPEAARQNFFAAVKASKESAMQKRLAA